MQAYVHSTHTVNRPSFINPPKCINIPSDKLLKVVLPLYGLPEIGFLWFQTYHDHYIEKLRMRASIHDLCFLYTPNLMDKTSTVRGDKCLQAEDTLNIGSISFMDLGENEGLYFHNKPIRSLREGTIKLNGSIIELQNGI